MSLYTGLFDEYLELSRFPYRDPLLEFGNPEKATDTQLKAWDFLRSHSGALIAIIGAKGAAKTYFGGAFAMHMGQKFPGSIGLVMSNTYQQVKDNAGPKIMELAALVNFEVEFFERVKIRGKPFVSVYVVRMPNGKEFYLFARSFDAIHRLEGFEPDWGWFEEVQQTTQDNFRIAFSRVRGAYADNSIFVAGMPERAHHWQYKFLPAIGFTLEKDLTDESNGVMYWPSLYENVKNVGQRYLDRMLKSHTGEQAVRYIDGLPASITSGKIFYSFEPLVHQMGLMSRLLCEYDPYLPLSISIDFNMAPMTATIWQYKPWNDKWDDPLLEVVSKNEVYRLTPKLDRILPAITLDDVGRPDTQIMAQVGEMECWSGGTEGLMDLIIAEWGHHSSGYIVKGDATGNAMKTSSSESDWEIIEKRLAVLSNVEIIRGLIQRMDLNSGKKFYSNPSVRDTINVANTLLENAIGERRICLLPESKLESGGLAASLAMSEARPDGTIDKMGDKESSENKGAVRSHFADTFRYEAVYFNGGVSVKSGADFDKEMDRAQLPSDGGSSVSTSGALTGLGLRRDSVRGGLRTNHYPDNQHSKPKGGLKGAIM